VQLLKEFHVAFAYLTVASFVARGLLSIADSPLRNAKWIRIAPHIIDTLLLAFGIALAVTMSLPPLANSWLMAKIVGLLAYIGFMSMMRARSRPLKIVGFVARSAGRYISQSRTRSRSCRFSVRVFVACSVDRNAADRLHAELDRCDALASICVQPRSVRQLSRDAAVLRRADQRRLIGGGSD
jgi:uncharacterized membrane protein SirB2